MKKILIFEPNSNQALALSKYIKKYSDFYIVGCLEKKVYFNRNSYDEIIITDFLNVDISEYLYVLPMGAKSTYVIINKYKELNYCNNIKFDINNLIAFNKPKMLSIVSEINIPVPKTFYKAEEIDIFPIFYKENFESGCGIRGIAYRLDDIPKKEGLIFQEYINTPSTYGVGFLAKNGVILTYTVHKEVISYPVLGGSAVLIESYYNKKLIEYTSKIVKKLNYNGWGLAEYKYCNRRNDFVFMEINAKFWASIEFMLINNSQFLKLLLDIDYKSQKENRILFINRLLQYTFLDIFKNSKYIFGSKLVKESCLLHQVIRKFLPDKIVNLCKKVIKYD